MVDIQSFDCHKNVTFWMFQTMGRKGILYKKNNSFTDETSMYFCTKFHVLAISFFAISFGKHNLSEPRRIFLAYVFAPECLIMYTISMNVVFAYNFTVHILQRLCIKFFIFYILSRAKHVGYWFEINELVIFVRGYLLVDYCRRK